MAAKRGRKPKAAPAIAGKVAKAALKVVKADPRPEAPGDMKGVALDAWGSLCDDLAGQKTLDSADRKLMEVYCRLYATLRRIEIQLADEPLTKVSEVNGRTFINPLVASQSDYANKLRQCLNDLGLTPKSRKSPQGPGDETDPMTAFLQG
jgi:P27 family predicted phage terminase small subunit